MFTFVCTQNIKNMVKNKLIVARTEKGLSQQEMADLLYMDQSQYSRREKGITKISEEEWDKIATILKKDLEEIYEEETNVTIHNDNGSHGSVNYASHSGNTNIYNIPDFMLENQQEYIELLKKEIARLKAELETPR